MKLYVVELDRPVTLILVEGVAELNSAAVVEKIVPELATGACPFTDANVGVPVE